MWTADRWKDYEVIDTSNGEKLERWGDYRLIRPDPQVIWDTPRGRLWKRPNAHYHRSKKGGGEWEFFDLPAEWCIRYPLAAGPSPQRGTAVPEEASAAPADGSSFSEKADFPVRAELTFRLKPFSFKHTGLFPEQAVNWDWFHGLLRERVKAGGSARVLNLFAYTGGATAAAAAAGAQVTHVDASKGMVGWAKENAQLSGLGGAQIRWLVDDCGKFVEREIRRGNRYDAIIMDPPSYGRGPKGEIWKIEESIFPFLKRCALLLSEDPVFVLLNSYTTGLQPAVLSYMLRTVLEPAFGGTVEAEEIGLPVSSNGLVLPCGASGRWYGGK